MAKLIAIQGSRYGWKAALILPSEFFDLPAGSTLRVWSGTAWAAKPVKVWTGAQWLVKPVMVLG